DLLHIDLLDYIERADFTPRRTGVKEHRFARRRDNQCGVSDTRADVDAINVERFQGFVGHSPAGSNECPNTNDKPNDHEIHVEATSIHLLSLDANADAFNRRVTRLAKRPWQRLSDPF